MTSGRRFGSEVRREFYDRVCAGAPVKHAAVELGVSFQAGYQWWRKAGAMRLLNGKGKLGLAEPGDLTRAGGPGRRLSFTERVAIMRGLDAGLSYAAIGAQLGVVTWEVVDGVPA